MLSNWLWISRCGDYWQQAKLRTDGACRIMMMMMNTKYQPRRLVIRQADYILASMSVAFQHYTAARHHSENKLWRELFSVYWTVDGNWSILCACVDDELCGVFIDAPGADDGHTSSIRHHAQSAMTLPASVCWNIANANYYLHCRLYPQYMYPLSSEILKSHWLSASHMTPHQQCTTLCGINIRYFLLYTHAPKSGLNNKNVQHSDCSIYLKSFAWSKKNGYWIYNNVDVT